MQALRASGKGVLVRSREFAGWRHRVRKTSVSCMRSTRPQVRRLSSARPFRDGEFYDAASKLDTDAKGTVSVALADLPTEVLDSLARHARTLWDGLGCRSAARIDFMVTSDGQVYALEVNTTPGMSRESN